MRQEKSSDYVMAAEIYK